MKRTKYRLVSNLSSHECEELEEDFGLNLTGSHVLLLLSKDEITKLCNDYHILKHKSKQAIQSERKKFLKEVSQLEDEFYQRGVKDTEIKFQKKVEELEEMKHLIEIDAGDMTSISHKELIEVAKLVHNPQLLNEEYLSKDNVLERIKKVMEEKT